MIQTNHTPLPWTFQENRSGMISNDVIGHDRNTVACYVGSKNAAFIVKACNAHYELLSAITFILSDLNSKLDYEAREILLAAIAKAEGKNP